MSKRPKPTKEVVVHKVSGGMISIDISSKRAFDWVIAESHKFGYLVASREHSASVFNVVLVINSCFVLDEVVEYLSEPAYEVNNVLSIVE